MNKGQEQKTVVFKLALLGDKGVGKRALRELYFGYRKDFGEEENNLLKFSIKRVKVDGREIVFQVWEFNSGDEYEALREIHYRGVRAAILVFDVTNPSTYQNLPFWLEELWKKAGKVPLIICGNKKNQRAGKERKDITVPEHGKVYCNKIKEKTGIEIQYIETDEDTGENLEEAFQFLAKATLKSIDFF